MYILDSESVEYLNSNLGLSFERDEYSMIFFLVSKSEHDNMDPDKTFMSSDGGSVFTYAEALPYDWKERGVTMGIVGFTTANSGKAEWGDAQDVLRLFHKSGGPDLVEKAMRCHQSIDRAKSLCKEIRSLSPEMSTIFTRCQLESLTKENGYLFEAVNSIRTRDITVNPLMVAAVFDTLLNFGIGGKYCPLKWLKKYATRGDETKTLRNFLKWKRVASCKNHHNSCSHNGKARSDMFRDLLDDKAWNLEPSTCKRVVRWTMK